MAPHHHRERLINRKGEMKTSSLSTVDGAPQSGWGIWIFENHHYEGNFENGMPNGEGTLTVYNEEDAHVSKQVFEGMWVDGYADGDIILSNHKWDGSVLAYEIPLVNGRVTENMTFSPIGGQGSVTSRTPNVVTGVAPFARGVFVIENWQGVSPPVNFPSVLIAKGEGNRIVFRITQPNLQSFLRDTNEYLWTVVFTTGNENWNVRLHKHEGRDLRYTYTAHATNTGSLDLLYSRWYFEENDVILDFLLPDGYSYNWDTLSNIEVDVYFAEGSLTVLKPNLADIERPIAQVEQQTYPYLSELYLNPDDITLTATRNANDTMTYTYTNKAIRHQKYIAPMEWFKSPALIQSVEILYSFHLFALREGFSNAHDPNIENATIIPTLMDMHMGFNPISYNNASFNDNKEYVFDIQELLKIGYYINDVFFPADDVNISFGNNGLTVTWTQAPLHGRRLDDIIEFGVRASYGVLDVYEDTLLFPIQLYGYFYELDILN